MKDLIDTAFYLEGKLVYKKLKSKYRIFCMKCQRYEYVSKKEFKQIQASRICPMCYQEVVLTTIQDHVLWKYIMDQREDGYIVIVNYRFGRKPKTETIHVCRYIGYDKVETRLIQCNMGYSFGYRPDMKEWKIRRSAPYYYRFYSINTGKQISNKKEFIYTSLFDRGIKNEEANQITKSNQKKIFQDNLMNGLQMEYVIAFDLKSYDEVYKYRAYMKKNIPNVKCKLNVYYLDYLYRNKIQLRDFYDYMKDCQELGFKLDKPKDFQHRHLVVSQLVSQKRNERIEKLTKERYVELIKSAYSNGDIQILPFKDAKEIRDCGKQLHNCIGSYVSSYSQKKTDLFYLSKKGKKTIAIEVNNNKLIQARSDRNRDCPADLKKHIRKWCAQNRFDSKRIAESM